MSTNTPALNASDSGHAPHILVPLDSSNLAAMALPVAESMCRQLSARLDLVSVLQPTALPFVGGEPYILGDVYTRIDAERTLDAQKYLEAAALAARDRGMPTQTRLERGDAASRLLNVAKELQSTLILMTTHGRTGLARFTLGSIADRMVRGGATLHSLDL